MQLQRLQIEVQRLQAEAAERTRRAELKAAEKARQFALETQRLQAEIQKQLSEKTGRRTSIGRSLAKEETGDEENGRAKVIGNSKDEAAAE